MPVTIQVVPDQEDKVSSGEVDVPLVELVKKHISIDTQEETKLAVYNDMFSGERGTTSNILLVGNPSKRTRGWAEFFDKAQIYALISQKEDWEDCIGERIRQHAWDPKGYKYEWLHLFLRSKTYFSFILVDNTVANKGIIDTTFCETLWSLLKVRGVLVMERLGTEDAQRAHKFTHLNQELREKNTLDFIQLADDSKSYSVAAEKLVRTELTPKVEDTKVDKLHCKTLPPKTGEPRDLCGTHQWPYALTLVTALISLDRYEKRPLGKNLHDYLRAFDDLRNTQIPIIVFVDKEDKTTATFIQDAPNVQVYLITAANCFVKQRYEELNQPKPDIDWQDFELPTQRNGLKDTPNYFLTQWSKFRWLNAAIRKNPFKTTHFAWVDIAAFRSCPGRPPCMCINMPLKEQYGYLRTVATFPQTENVRFPSKLAVAAQGEDWNTPHWWWAGNFLVGHRDALYKVCALFEREARENWINKKRYSWELNVLGEVVRKEPALFERYTWTDHLYHVKNFYQWTPMVLS